jgi:hypothetical protein
MRKKAASGVLPHEFIEPAHFFCVLSEHCDPVAMFPGHHRQAAGKMSCALLIAQNVKINLAGGRHDQEASMPA